MMRYALYLNGDKVKEAERLPTLDQSMPVMQDGYEWRTIDEDPTPEYDPVYQIVSVLEMKRAGGKLKKTKRVWDKPLADWQRDAKAAVARRLEAYLNFRDFAVEIITGVDGPAIARARAAIDHAHALAAQIDAGTKPDLKAGWPE